MNIKVKRMRIVTNQSVLRAVFELALDDAVVIHSVFLAEKDGRQFVFMPFMTWNDKEGNEHHYNVVELMTEKIKEQILRAVTEAYDSAIKNKSIEEGRENNV